MIVTTVIAVALGIAPVDATAAQVVVSGNYDFIVGRYSQSVDRKGVTHLRGFDPRSGAAYDVAIKDGGVQATVGEREITFRIAPAK